MRWFFQFYVFSLIKRRRFKGNQKFLRLYQVGLSSKGGNEEKKGNDDELNSTVDAMSITIECNKNHMHTVDLCANVCMIDFIFLLKAYFDAPLIVHIDNREKKGDEEKTTFYSQSKWEQIIYVTVAA